MWGYCKENGPATWHKHFPVAAGTRQSPIDIKLDACKSDGGLSKVKATYADVAVSTLQNTGSSWKAQVSGGKSSLTGGPLGEEFVLEQFHCHWGKSDKSGSEHTVDGTMYPAELHLVHWNKDKFKSFAEAAAADNGLTVLGIFLKAGKEHSELKKISKLLPFIKFKGQSITVLDTFQPDLFLPSDGSYWTYPGSLTTPPCYESVNWVVFHQPIEVSEEQLNAFRNMKSYHPCEECPKDELHGCMFENYRPPCPLNERTVRVYKDSKAEE